MKLKTLLFLETGGPGGMASYPSAGMGYGPMSSQDTTLRPWPGSMDDKDAWNGIIEGDGWFLYKEANDWNKRQAGASITITEGKPHKFKIKIKTKNLKKPKDTNAILYDRVRRHTDKVAKAWIGAAKKIKNNAPLNEIGEVQEISWETCFREALNDPNVKPYIEGWEEYSMVDPVNFTPRM